MYCMQVDYFLCIPSAPQNNYYRSYFSKLTVEHNKNVGYTRTKYCYFEDQFLA